MENLKNFQITWQARFDEATSNIERMLSDTSRYDPEFISLANHIVNNSYMHYDDFNQWNNFVYSPLDLESYLHLIHHALVDDGSITFLSPNPVEKKLRKPLMVFLEERDHIQDKLTSFFSSAKDRHNHRNKILHASCAEKLGKSFAPTEFIDDNLSTYKTHHNVKKFIKESVQYHIETEKRSLEIDKRLKALDEKQ